MCCMLLCVNYGGQDENGEMETLFLERPMDIHLVHVSVLSQILQELELLETLLCLGYLQYP